MKRPSCVIAVRSDLTAIVCSHCPEEKLAKLGTEWCESRGYSASHGVCDKCLPIHFPFMAEYRAAKREGREPVYTVDNCPDTFTLHALTGRN